MRRRGGDGRRLGRIGRRVVCATLRQTEVDHFHPAVGEQDDVCRLQIAMDDAFFVGRVQCVRDLPRDRQRVADRNGSQGTVFRPRQSLRERLSFDELEDEGVHAISIFEAVDGPDVRMIERSERARLALEACMPVGIGGEAGGQDLDRDVATELRVARAINFAHPARSEQGSNFVRS